MKQIHYLSFGETTEPLVGDAGVMESTTGELCSVVCGDEELAAGAAATGDLALDDSAKGAAALADFGEDVDSASAAGGAEAGVPLEEGEARFLRTANETICLNVSTASSQSPSLR